jgi:hypothetical protein
MPPIQQAKRVVLQAETLVNQATEFSCSSFLKGIVEQISTWIKNVISCFRGEQESVEFVPVQTYVHKPINQKLVRTVAADMRSINPNLAWDCSEENPVRYALLTPSADIQEDTQIIKLLLDRYDHVHVKVVGEDLGRVAELQKLSPQLKVELVSLSSYFNAIDSNNFDHFVTYMPYTESSEVMRRDLGNLKQIAGKSSLYVAERNLGLWRITSKGDVRVFDGMTSDAEIREMFPVATSQRK